MTFCRVLYKNTRFVSGVFIFNIPAGVEYAIASKGTTRDRTPNVWKARKMYGDGNGGECK